MGLFNWGEKTKAASPEPVQEYGDIGIVKGSEGLHKAYIPEFLYKPPFGYPRKENLPMLRTLSKNPYIYSVVKSLTDEAASTSYDVVYKDGVEATPELDDLRKQILKFFDNPNGNKESFKHIVRAVVRDIAELDSGVMVKAYNKRGVMSEIYARDGGSFLKNPDIYGYIGNRSDYIKPTQNLNVTPTSADWNTAFNSYSLSYKDMAAYFQYGMTGLALPVPFGKREVIYIMQNPRSDSVYGRSPIQILADVIQTLVYGANYNLDFYMNNNMPEGIIQLMGANPASMKAFRERFESQFKTKDKVTGFLRKVFFKYPIVNQEAKFTPFQLDPKVMQILEQQEWFTKLVWACFGITADEMGFTENSNKATSESQASVYKRKAVRPMLEVLKYHFDKEIISEWGELAFDSFEWKWEDYDLGEDIKRHSLLKMQLDMGLKTPEMIANDEGIDYEQVKAYKDEQEAKEVDKLKLQQSFAFQQGDNSNNLKAEKYDNQLEEELVKGYKARAKQIEQAFDLYEKGPLSKLR